MGKAILNEERNATSERIKKYWADKKNVITKNHILQS